MFESEEELLKSLGVEVSTHDKSEDKKVEECLKLDGSDIIQTMVLQNIQFQQLVLSSMYLGKKEERDERKREDIGTQTDEYRKIIQKNKPLQTININSKNVEDKEESVQIIENEDYIQTEARIENTKSKSKIVFIAILFIQVLRKKGKERREIREKVEAELINNGKVALYRIIKNNPLFSQAVKEMESLDVDVLVQDNNLFTFFKSKTKNSQFLNAVNFIISLIESIKIQDNLDMINFARALRLLCCSKIFKSYYYEVELEILPLGNLVYLIKRVKIPWESL